MAKLSEIFVSSSGRIVMGFRDAMRLHAERVFPAKVETPRRELDLSPRFSGTGMETRTRNFRISPAPPVTK